MYLHNVYYITFICVPKFYSKFWSDIRAAERLRGEFVFESFRVDFFW